MNERHTIADGFTITCDDEHPSWRGVRPSRRKKVTFGDEPNLGVMREAETAEAQAVNASGGAKGMVEGKASAGLPAEGANTGAGQES